MRGWLRPDRLFVYGSLRAWKRRPHPLLGPARFLGTALVNGRAVPAGLWPGAIPDSRMRLRGELYQLLRPRASFARLDRYEGCRPGNPAAGRYRRARVLVSCGREARLAWIYWFGTARRR